MTEASIEADADRIDPADMDAIVAALDAIAVSAGSVSSTTTDDAPDWTLTVRWLQKGPVAADTEAALPDVLTRIREHFTRRRRTPPARIDLVDDERRPLLTVDACADRRREPRR
jgi:hypothetical protein